MWLPVYRCMQTKVALYISSDRKSMTVFFYCWTDVTWILLPHIDHSKPFFSSIHPAVHHCLSVCCIALCLVIVILHASWLRHGSPISKISRAQTLNLNCCLINVRCLHNKTLWATLNGIRVRFLGQSASLWQLWNRIWTLVWVKQAKFDHGVVHLQRRCKQTPLNQREEVN